MCRLWKSLDWTGISGFKVSNDGLVMGRSGKILKPANQCENYYYVCLSNGRKNKRRYYIHRLVAGSFIRQIEDDEDVHHIDGLRDNNSVENLEIIHREPHRWGSYH